jgi:hypothetical protein
LAAWYRAFGERAGNPAIWDARLRTAEDMEAEASRIEQRTSAYSRVGSEEKTMWRTNGLLLILQACGGAIKRAAPRTSQSAKVQNLAMLAKGFTLACAVIAGLSATPRPAAAGSPSLIAMVWNMAPANFTTPLAIWVDYGGCTLGATQSTEKGKCLLMEQI